MICQVQAKDLSDWKVEKVEPGIYELSNGSYKARLDKTNVLPKVKDVKEYGKLKVVLYHAFTSGTSFMVDEIYGAVFDSKSKKLLGLYPHNYESLSEKYQSEDMEQPKWLEKDGELIIVDQELGLKKTLSTK
jgi:hypothetical protein